MPHGTGFLPGDYVSASRHTDLELENAAVRWIKSLNLEIIVMKQDDLEEAILNEGFAKEISEEA